jgi:hypothetical protein
MACSKLKQIMGPPKIVVQDHNGNVNVILQSCDDTDVCILRRSLIGNIENSAINEHNLSKEQHLNVEKLKKKPIQ